MKLNDWLERENISHSTFSKLSGVSQSVISRIVRVELEKEEPTGIGMRTFMRITVATDGEVSVMDMLAPYRDKYER